MTTQEAFDIRQKVIDTIGFSWDVYKDGTDISTVSIVDDYNDRVYIPLGLPTQTRTESLWEMPYIEVTLVDSPSKIVGVEHTIRNECYFDFNIFYTNTDTVDKEYGKKIADELCQKIYEEYTSVASVYWVEVLNSSRELFESDGKQVVFHRVVECYGTNYNR